MKRWYINRWISILLILTFIALQAITGHIGVAQAAWTGKVTANSLNVRSEPSVTAKKVQLRDIYVYLVKDETVNILKESGDFYYISVKFNGKTVNGYVHKDYIRITEKSKMTPIPKPTAKPTPKPSLTPKPNYGDSVAVVEEVKITAAIMASSLNVRSGPGTGYSKIASLAKGNSITVVSKVIQEDEEWYGISFRYNEKVTTGYVLSTYVKLSYDKSIKGVAITKLKLRSGAGTMAPYLKDKSSNILSSTKNKTLTIINETTVSGIKWFKVSVNVSEKKYVGYVQASQVAFKVTEKSVTSTPKPTVTPKPIALPEPTKKPSVTQEPSETVIPTPAVSPTPGAFYLQVPNNPVLSYVNTPVNGFVCNTQELNVVYDLVGYENMIDSTNKQIMLKNAQELLVNQVVSVDGITWYGVSLNNGMYGYALGQYIYISEHLPEEIASNMTAEVTPTLSPAAMDFESKLVAEGFPESYKTSLRSLHLMYPDWEFKAYHTGLDWNTVIDAESVPAKNLLSNTKSVEWKSLDTGAYNWKTDTFNVFDGSTWVTASREAIEYYMDPRNFLTAANGIFQFELLKYHSNYQDLAGVENILKGTAMYNSYYSYVDENGVNQTISYAETFLKAAEYSGVSPYHLASRVKQEVVTGPTTLSGSVTGTYSGYEGLFNFYNIGANDSAGGGAIAKGLTYAKNGSGNATMDLLYMIPWTSPYRSIVGGSYFIGGSYVNRGQDTIYLQKFNVTPVSTYYHQYMTNVEAPFAEGKKVMTAYNGMTDAPIIFSIPVYLNMPVMPAPMPITKFNPNNRMKSLKVTDMNNNELTITPSFNQTVYNYYLIVPSTVDSVQVHATAVSKKATLSGGGPKILITGSNTIIVSVVAEDGNQKNYTIIIERDK